MGKKNMQKKNQPKKTQKKTVNEHTRTSQLINPQIAHQDCRTSSVACWRPVFSSPRAVD